LSCAAEALAHYLELRCAQDYALVLSAGCVEGGWPARGCLHFAGLCSAISVVSSQTKEQKQIKTNVHLPFV